MKKKSLSWKYAVVFGCAVALLTACNDQSNEPMGQGQVDFEITDGPMDDASVKGVFVTVADVKVDGQSLAGFSKQTIDLKSYYDGNTKLLGSGTFDAHSYSNVSLILDLDTDAQGNSPGCYAITQDNAKYKLKSTTTGKTEIALSQSWNVAKDITNKIVFDFDLRKSLRYSDDASIKYSFVNDDALRSSIRVVAKEKSGMIKGSYKQESSVNADKIIVYAYRKGTFNTSSETQANAEGNTFTNAVASAEVKGSLTGKTFTIAYLPEGDYELHFAAYAKDTSSGRVYFQTMLKSETQVNGNIADIIRVQAATSITISSNITGEF